MNIPALSAGLFSGIIGAMGMGGGAVLIIYLTLFADTEQLKAQGINLIFFIPIALTAVIIYAVKREIKWKIALPIALGGALGALLGIWLTGILSSVIIGKIFGAFLTSLGILEFYTLFKK